MTNYNERLDAIFKTLNNKAREVRASCAERNNWEGHNSAYERLESDTKQAITSLIKELVAEAKPYRETIIDKWNKDRADEVKATNAAMNAWADIYEQNLLKALEEV